MSASITDPAARRPKGDRPDRPEKPGRRPGRGDEGKRKREQDWPEQRDPRPEEILKDYPLRRFHGERKDRYTPFLVLRHAGGDQGARPLAPGTTFWHSPDVWVVSSQGYNVPVAGEEVRIFARVSNGGLKDASGVVVRYWWANPSLAITEATAHLIGTATGVFVAGADGVNWSSVVVECPERWPVVMENGGHECIFAEAWAPYWDPIVAPLEPVTDRHVCQKNLHVVEAAAGKTFSFAIQVANISEVRQRVEVRMRTLSFRQVRAALAAPDIGFPEPLVETGRGMSLRMELAAEGGVLPAPTATYPLRLLSGAALAERGATACEPMGAVTQAALLRPWETRTLTLSGRVPDDARPRQAFGFDLHQRMGTVVTGGYTLYVVVAG